MGSRVFAAGLVADGQTEDGFGIGFGVNHLGHFLLTCLLLERLKESGGGRVVTLASMAYRWGHVDFEVSHRRGRRPLDSHAGTMNVQQQHPVAPVTSRCRLHSSSLLRGTAPDLRAGPSGVALLSSCFDLT